MTIRWCTFDCYGTRIDWEGGITSARPPFLARPVDRDARAKEYTAPEAPGEAGAGRSNACGARFVGRASVERYGRGGWGGGGWEGGQRL